MSLYVLDDVIMRMTPVSSWYTSTGLWTISGDNIIDDHMIIYTRHPNMPKAVLNFMVDQHNIEITLGLPESDMKTLARKAGYLSGENQREKHAAKKAKMFPRNARKAKEAVDSLFKDRVSKPR